MKRFLCFLFSLLLAVAVPVGAKDAPAPAGMTAPASALHYLEPGAIDIQALLPPPPAEGPAETQKEIEIMLEKQKTRTPEEVARAKSEVKLDVFAFADVLGPWFTPKNLPSTTAFFQNITEDVRTVTDAAKKDFSRPRPYVQDKRIQPAVDLEKSLSYPSGHATRAMVYALVLASLIPDEKEAILARGKQIGEDRVTGGVHFPSDVAAGQKLAEAIYAKLVANEAFQEAMVVAQTEIIGARAKK